MKAADSHTNKELFIRLGEGDVHAFREIFHYYTSRLHLFVFNIVKSHQVTEDIVQEVFLKLWANRGKVAGKDNPSSWLFTVAANTSYTYFRKMGVEKRFVDHVTQFMNNTASGNPTEDFLFSKENDSLLQQAIESLPPQRKLIFHLSRTEGLSRQEIASQLDISPNTVKNQLSSALKTIREFIRNAGALLLLLLTWMMRL